MSEQAKKDRAAELDRKASELQQLFVQLQKDLPSASASDAGHLR